MTRLDAAVFAWLVVMSLAAVGAHLFALRHTPRIAAQERAVHRATAMLAAFYALGYVAVLCNFVAVLPWSQFFRGVSLLVYPLVWIYPAVMSGRRWRHDSEAARRLVALAAERAPERVRDDIRSE